ncbi:MAG: hypothetical protein AAGH92_12050 [Planctomycetota bacterium]
MERRSNHLNPPQGPGNASGPTPHAVAAALDARRAALLRGVGLAPGFGVDAADSQPAPATETTDRGRKAPRLRLVAADPEQVVRPSVQPTQHEPISDTTDPRWVLAVRAAEKLEGSILRPEHRERLLVQGKAMGLTPFDTSLILAIVQDQARRGHAPAYCPTAGEPQLRMVPPVRRRAWPKWSMKRWLAVAAGVAAFTAVELAVLGWFFAG